MNKSWFYLVAVSSLAIVITSCSGDGDKATAPTPSPTVAASPAPGATPAAAPTAAAPATPTAPTAAGTTATSPVPAKPAPGKGVSVDVAAGLIPNTDPDNWARTVSKGRPDPFATLVLQPVEASLPKGLMNQPVKSANAGKANSSAQKGVKSGVDKPLPDVKVPSNIATKPTTPRNGKNDPDTGVDIKQIPKSGINRKLPKIIIAIKPTVTTPAQEKPLVAVKPIPTRTTPAKQKPLVVIKPLTEPIRAIPTPALAPSKPEPTLAGTVGVSGVIQVDGKTQVVVRLPNESFSRYVEVGDRIYDGKVTVKRVEGAQTLSPTVVFEEVGVEVNRRVGDPAKGVVEAAPVQPTPRLQ